MIARLLGGAGVAALAGCSPGGRGSVAAARASQLAIGEAGQPGNAVAGVFDVTAYGATGDGVTDDAPAIQAAVSDAVAAGGGTIFFPGARYRIGARISSNASADSNPSLYFVGTGSSVLLLDTPGAISFYGGNQGYVVFRQLVIIGFDQERSFDCTSGFYFGYVSSLIFDECRFLGIASSQMLINSNALEIRNCSFLGCSSPNRPMVFVGDYDPWRHVEISGTYFVDFGSYGGTYYSKTPAGVFAWIGTGNAGTNLGANSSSTIRIIRCGFDEGASWVLHMNGNGGKARVDVEDSTCLMNAGTGTGVFHFANARAAKVRGFSFDPKDKASDATFINAVACESVIVDQCSRTKRSNPCRIVASADCVSVQVIDSEYDELRSDAVATVGQEGGVRWRLRKTEGPLNAHTLVAPGTAQGHVSPMMLAVEGAQPIGISLDDATQAQEYIRVVEDYGQHVTVLSDGCPIAPGASLVASASMPGRITSQTSAGAASNGVALHAVDGSAPDQHIRVLWNRGVA